MGTAVYSRSPFVDLFWKVYWNLALLKKGRKKWCSNNY